ncbi:MAG TPA: TonB-dependent receptor [Gammaproteobacteria bacterium]|nr:TonB-dependent receptor [Gammaproteobacteria bacterium]
MHRRTRVTGARTARRGAVTGLLLLGALPAAGLCADLPYTVASANLPSEAYFLQAMPVVLSATHLAQRKDQAPAAVTVIGHRMIEASGATDIPDLFRLVPGFQVAYASGNQMVVTYHGMSDEYAKRMQVLVDGRSVYDPINGGVDWANLPLAIEDIDHIEVVRGPNGAAYGANAFLGTINIVTRHPAQDQGTFFRAAGGSRDFRKGVVRHGGRLGALTYRATLGYREDDGFEGRHDYRRISLATFRGDYRATARDHLEVMTGYAGGPHGAGVSPTSDLEPLHRSDVHEHFEQVRWRHTSPGSGEYSLQFYHNYRRVSEFARQPILASRELGITPAQFQALTGEPDQHLPLNYSTLEHRYQLDFQHHLPLNSRTRLVWGASARLDQGGGPQWFSRPDLIETRLYRLFGNVEWHLRPSLEANLGAMVEKSSLTGTHLAPRAALNYRFRPHQTLRLSVAQAFRMPTLYEDFAHTGIVTQQGTPLYIRFIGPGNLRPERIVSYELGYLGRWERYGVSLDAKAYHDEISDWIAKVDYKQYPQPYGGTLSGLVYNNSRGVIVNGAELSLRYRPQRQTTVLFNYAYAHASGVVLNSIDPPKPPEFRTRAHTVPTHTESLLVIQQLPRRVQLSAVYYRVSPMRWLGNGDILHGQDRLDLRIAKGFRVGNVQSKVSVVLQNALDNYTEFRHENIFKHRLYAQLDVTLP